MARIFITGSADGLGQMAAKVLVAEGHTVVLHARNKERGDDAHSAVPGAEGVVCGDLSSIQETLQLAEAVNAMGNFDAIIHNAGVGYREQKRNPTTDGLPLVFAVNTLSTYILTCAIQKPKRLVYLSSGLHSSGDASLQDLLWEKRVWSGFQAYSDTKLHDAMLAFFVARKWTDVLSNAVEPGWVATKMGGTGATDNLAEGPETQAWLATTNDVEALVSGKYWYHKKVRQPVAAVSDVEIQDRLLAELQRISGISFPE